MTGDPTIVKVTSLKNDENLSRYGLLEWINAKLELNVLKIEHLCSGWHYCKLVDKLYPGIVPFKRVKLDAKLEHDFIHNYKVLQEMFLILKVEKPVPVDLLVKGKFQHNLEFFQWFRKFYDSNANNKHCEIKNKVAKARTNFGSKSMETLSSCEEKFKTLTRQASQGAEIEPLQETVAANAESTFKSELQCSSAAEDTSEVYVATTSKAEESTSKAEETTSKAEETTEESTVKEDLPTTNEPSLSEGDSSMVGMAGIGENLFGRPKVKKTIASGDYKKIKKLLKVKCTLVSRNMIPPDQYSTQNPSNTNNNDVRSTQTRAPKKRNGFVVKSSRGFAANVNSSHLNMETIGSPLNSIYTLGNNINQNEESNREESIVDICEDDLTLELPSSPGSSEYIHSGFDCSPEESDMLSQSSISIASCAGNLDECTSFGDRQKFEKSYKRMVRERDFFHDQLRRVELSMELIGSTDNSCSLMEAITEILNTKK